MPRASESSNVDVQRLLAVQQTASMNVATATAAQTAATAALASANNPQTDRSGSYIATSPTGANPYGDVTLANREITRRNVAAATAALTAANAELAARQVDLTAANAALSALGY